MLRDSFLISVTFCQSYLFEALKAQLDKVKTMESKSLIY